MELCTFAQFGIIGRVTAVPKFVLTSSPCKSFYLHLREKHFEISAVDYTTLIVVPEKFNLSRCILEYPSDWPTEFLSKDPKAIYKSLKLSNFSDAILDAKWNPENYRQKPTITPLNAQFSQAVNGHIFLGMLVSSGAFHLYKREKKMWKDWCNIAEEHVKLWNPSELLRNYDEIQDALGVADIVAFDWLEPNGNEFSLLWVSRDGSVFSGVFNATAENIKITKLSSILPDPASVKIISNSQESRLILVSTSGEVSLYDIQRTSRALKLAKIADLWNESDDVSVSGLAHQFHDNGLRVFIVKGFFLVVCELSSEMEVTNRINQRLPCPFITGLQLNDEKSFILALSNHKIVMGTLAKGKIQIEDLRNDFDGNFSCTGIIAGKNKAVCVLAFNASKPFDYTQLKTPEQFQFATFSKFNPFQVALDDPEKRVSNHFEYFEMIRSTKTDTSSDFAKLMGKINNEAADVDETLYFLKIQYHLLDISTRAKNNAGIELKSKVRLLRDIIKAINFHKSLGMLLKVDTKHTEEQFLSIQNIRASLSSLQLPQGQTEYLELLKRLKQRFHGTIQKSKILSVKEIPENCNLCDHQIGPGLNCVQLHAFKRCVYTNLQIPILSTESCRVCGAQALDSKSIERILGTPIPRPLCSTCDVEIE